MTSPHCIFLSVLAFSFASQRDGGRLQYVSRITSPTDAEFFNFQSVFKVGQSHQKGVGYRNASLVMLLMQLTPGRHTPFRNIDSGLRRSSRISPSWMLRRASFPIATANVNDATFRSSFLTLFGVRHHIRDTGEVDPSGPVAIFIHGFAGSTESWNDVAPKLAAGGCRAIAIDRVGFGRTERPIPPTFPAPPPVPFGEVLGRNLQALFNSSQQQQGGLAFPDPISALAMGLANPETLAPRLPWELSNVGENPYSSKFAVSRVLWELIREKIKPSALGTRSLYLVGHSAGGPLALRALVECSSSSPSPLPQGIELAGVALFAPAAIDPREDLDLYSNDAVVLKDVPLPPVLRKRADLELRRAAFKAVVSLPDAFGLQTARRIAEGRDLEEAVRGQMHPRMSAPAFKPRVKELALKYSKPIREFPDAWDRALLNVYRADLSEDSGLFGRDLLAAARRAKQKLQRVRVLVATGDDDRIVSPLASQRVAELVAAERFLTLNETGHIPMDERPDEVAELLLNFMRT